MLHITMQDLINFAKYKDAEIVQGRKASEYNYEIVKNDFVCFEQFLLYFYFFLDYSSTFYFIYWKYYSLKL